MSNADLIERLSAFANRLWDEEEILVTETIDTLAAADKRIAELEARLGQIIAGFDVGQAARIGEILVEKNEAERKLAVAREALRYAYEEAKGWYDESRGDVLVLPFVEKALAQIGEVRRNEQ